MPVPLTLLTITPLYGPNTPELTPYSARGLRQEFELIIDNPMGKQIHRTINGGLLDLTYDQFRKYRTIISCTDQAAPAFDGAKQGTIVQVDCCKEMVYRTIGGSPSRPMVHGTDPRVEGDFTYYYPSLTMMVISFKEQFDECEAKLGWTLVLEEI